ncbi:DUF2214 domain-containing protein [Rhizobiales bacterium RZME27]|uniref:DUF2214 domain-containing protein n=1 Tax=Endobacterium cereale TaxID=2663029 RepID=A0A6A8A695_9HYPH|nr:DUF6644 family protein [Endobacterium cereale]MEB2846345.1 DUF6644 family protein [Endobacterium cereale]MQY46359.1 DUF2214 domain-containing protein [Endobacterium cereale]
MLSESLLAFENTALAASIRSSVSLYATINALHILGLAVLVGAVLTFDLRASGVWKVQRWRDGFEVAIPVAGFGLALAILTGVLLFAVRGTHYVTLPVFLMKMAILPIGFLNIVICHWLVRRSTKGLPSPAIRLCAFLSAAIWISALLMGRWIAFST